jgi:hypothetical protein
MNTEINCNSQENKKLMRADLALKAKDMEHLIKENEELKSEIKILQNKVRFQILSYTSSYHKWWICT